MKAKPSSAYPVRPIPALLFVILFGLLGATNGASAGEASYYRDLFSDTWVGHDALGRNLPTCSVVGPVKNDHRRVVGIFYITWHSDSAHQGNRPYTGGCQPNPRPPIRRPGWMLKIRSGSAGTVPLG